MKILPDCEKKSSFVYSVLFVYCFFVFNVVIKQLAVVEFLINQIIFMKKKEFIKELKRSHYCGQLRKSHADSAVVLMGWIRKIRDHGGLLFLDLRDKTGYVQVVLDQKKKGMEQVSLFWLGKCGGCSGNSVFKAPRYGE